MIPEDRECARRDHNGRLDGKAHRRREGERVYDCTGGYDVFLDWGQVRELYTCMLRARQVEQSRPESDG